MKVEPTAKLLARLIQTPPASSEFGLVIVRPDNHIAPMAEYAPKPIGSLFGGTRRFIAR